MYSVGDIRPKTVEKKEMEASSEDLLTLVSAEELSLRLEPW